jgi:hypothetical protein
MIFTIEDVCDDLGKKYPKMKREVIKRVVQWGMRQVKGVLRYEIPVLLDFYQGTGVAFFNPESRERREKNSFKRMLKIQDIKANNKLKIEHMYSKLKNEKK